MHTKYEYFYHYITSNYSEASNCSHYLSSFTNMKKVVFTLSWYIISVGILYVLHRITVKLALAVTTCFFQYHVESVLVHCDIWWTPNNSLLLLYDTLFRHDVHHYYLYYNTHRHIIFNIYCYAYYNKILQWKPQ